MVKTTLKIDGMMCGMCEAHMNDAIRAAFKVKKVTSSHANGRNGGHQRRTRSTKKSCARPSRQPDTHSATSQASRMKRRGCSLSENKNNPAPPEESGGAELRQ